MSARKTRLRPAVKPRIRVLCGDEIALGPGKTALLRAIAGSGSIAAAARSLDMSYMRAWKLVRTMNACFREPLVEVARGGSSKGGAHLTATGERALTLYDAMERTGLAGLQPAWQQLARLLVR